MVNITQVFEAADAIRKKGEHVTQRTVIPWLQERYRGASPRDLGPLLKKWKHDRNYHRTIEKAELPDAVQRQLAAATDALWKAARAALEIEIVNVRLDLDAKDAEIKTRDATIEVLTARLAIIEPEQRRLADENGRLGEENAALRARLDAADERLRKVRANEFWDRVMRELHARMPPGAWLTVDEIEPLVPRHLVGEARGHAEEWSTTTLRKKLDQRTFWDKYFAKDKEARRYRRPPEAA